MKNTFCLVALSCALGCATPVVRPYIGEQAAWPTAPGSVVMTRYELPVFTTLPPVPYNVVAELRLESPFYAQPEPGQMPVLVKKAKELGADAIALVEPNTFFNALPLSKTGTRSPLGSTTPSNKFNPESFLPGVIVVAIKWADQPPADLPAKYLAGRPAAPVVKTPAVTTPETKPAIKDEPKTNFGPTRPADEQRLPEVVPPPPAK
jgi:hypothetical protein